MWNVVAAVAERVFGEASVREGGRDVGVAGIVRKSVMMRFAAAANDDGSGVYMSVLRTAVDVETSENNARRAIKSLLTEGLLIDTGPITMANGAVMTNYTISLDALSKLPVAKEQFKEKRTAKRAKKQGKTKASGASTMGAPKSGAGAPTTGVRGAPTMGEISPTMGAETNHTGSLPSKEEREPVESVKSGRKQEAGFSLTPNAGAASKAKPGKSSLPMTQPPAAVEFYDAMRGSDFFAALPQPVRNRTMRRQTIEVLGPVLAKHDRDLVARVVAGYYRGQMKIKGGENAKGLQNVINDGLLDDLIADATRTAKPVPVGGALSLEDAMRRLKSPNWRQAWGHKDDAIYDAARAAMAQARV